jgi:predicted glycosyltransferase
MRFLFFFVHPSKYHLYRITINELIKRGHDVEIAITSKDVLEDLVKKEGWNYTNIFPQGRKIKGLPTYIGAGINTFRSIWRLLKLTRGKKYNLFLTDDLLTIAGRIKGVPTIHFQDDDLAAVPESVVLMKSCSYILAPAITDFGKYNYKKIGFEGFKASAYLHPNHFKINEDVLEKYGLKHGANNETYYIIRLVSLTATHDVGKTGITNEDCRKLISMLEKKGKVIITSERAVTEEFEKYRMNIQPEDMSHILAGASLFIGDSQTMSSEAGMLGIPYIRFNDFVGRLGYLNDLERNYKLGFGILTKDREKLFAKVEELLKIPDLKNEWKKRRENMLNKTVDLSKLQIWLYENYPDSIKKWKDNPSITETFGKYDTKQGK